MKTIGIGIIGWGFMGRTHTLAIRSLPLFYENADFRAGQESFLFQRHGHAQKTPFEFKRAPGKKAATNLRDAPRSGCSRIHELRTDG